MSRAYINKSTTTEWGSPQDLFDQLNLAFGFTLDVCALPSNANCKRFFTPEQDGLAQSWTGERCWMNPPYGREISQWIDKAYFESRKGALVVCLVPARTDTQWWHDVCSEGDVHLIRGRLKFGGSKNSAPFPSAIVVFYPKP